MHVYVQDACQETHIFSSFSGLLDIANNPFHQLQLYDMHKNADLFGTRKLSSHLHPGSLNGREGTC